MQTQINNYTISGSQYWKKMKTLIPKQIWSWLGCRKLSQYPQITFSRIQQLTRRWHAMTFVYIVQGHTTTIPMTLKDIWAPVSTISCESHTNTNTISKSNLKLSPWPLSYPADRSLKKSGYTYTDNKGEKPLRKKQTLCAGCSKADPKISLRCRPSNTRRPPATDRTDNNALRR